MKCKNCSKKILPPKMRYCSVRCRAYAEHRRNSHSYKKYRKDYYHAHKEYFSAKHKEWVKNNRELVRWHKTLRTYKKFGLTKTVYEEMVATHGGRCAICGKEPKTKRLFIDHDHKTGKLRGLLCTNCNTVLGMVDDDKEILRSSINYLDKW